MIFNRIKSIKNVLCKCIAKSVINVMNHQNRAKITNVIFINFTPKIVPVYKNKLNLLLKNCKNPSE